MTNIIRENTSSPSGFSHRVWVLYVGLTVRHTPVRAQSTTPNYVRIAPL